MVGLGLLFPILTPSTRFLALSINPVCSLMTDGARFRCAALTMQRLLFGATGGHR